METLYITGITLYNHSAMTGIKASRCRRILSETGLFALLWAGIAGFSAVSLLPAAPHGDEPHYLMMTVSLLKEWDLNLADNYARLDYQAFTPNRITPHRSTFEAETLYSHHLPGLSIMLVPSYWLAGRNGTVFFLTFFSALTAWMVSRWSINLGLNRHASVFSAIALGWTLPAIMIGGMAFPELPAAACLTAVLWWFSTKKSPVLHMIGCVLLCALPWFHLKYAVFSAAGYVWACIINRKNRLFITGSLIFAGSAAALFFLFQYTLYGDVFYLLKFHASGFRNPIRGVLGLFLDRETGLWIYSPVFMISIAGITRLKRTDTVMILLTILSAAYIIFSGSWSVWHSGHAPPARYLVPLLPVMGVLMAFAMTQVSRPLYRTVAGLLLAISLLNVLCVMIQIPETVIVVGDGIHRLYTRFSPWLGYGAPSLINPVSGMAWSLAGWLCLAVSVAIPYSRFSRISGSRRLRMICSGLILPGLAVVFIGMGIGRETAFRHQQSLTPLSVAAPLLCHPAPEAVFNGTMPDLIWDPVSGADGYKWYLSFPEGYEIGVETYGKTVVELPDSVLNAIPEGRYTWWVVPMKDGRTGTASPKRHFTLNKLPDTTL
jgi:hypothetical protein